MTVSLFRKWKTTNSFPNAFYSTFIKYKDDDIKKVFLSRSNDCNGSKNMSKSPALWIGKRCGAENKKWLPALILKVEWGELHVRGDKFLGGRGAIN